MPNDGWNLAVNQLSQVTLLIPALVLLVRWLGRKRSHLAYGLLVVALLKCVTPPVWSSRAGVFSWTAALTAPDAVDSAELATRQPQNTGPDSTSPASEQRLNMAGTDAATSVPADVATISATDQSPRKPQAASEPAVVPIWKTIDWKWLAGLALFLIWSLGMAVVAGRLLWEIWRLRQWCHTAEPAGESIRNQARVLSRQMGLPATPEVLVTEEAVMPAAMGVWREVVLLPRHLIDSVSPEEFELVLAHELNHFRRWDTLIGSLQAAAQVVWWFHPLVWWLNRELRRYREQCCDEEILARLECRPPQYARCLLNVLELNERFSPALGLAGMSPFEVTSHRLRNIMRSRSAFTAGMPKWCWLVLVASALIVLPGAGLTPKANALPNVTGVTPRPEQAVDADAPTNPGVRPEAPRETVAAELPDQLRYRWQAGEHLAYQTRVEMDLGDEIETYSGTLSLSVRSVDDRGAELVLGGMGLTSFRRPKPGWIPRLGAPSFPDIPRPTFGLPPERSLRVDAFGRILTERGESEMLPGLLGNWTSYVLQPLPDQPTSEWTIASTETVSFEADRFREQTVQNRLGGPFRRPATEALRAVLNADCRITPADDGTFIVTKDYTLATVEQVNGNPRAEMSGVKSVTWNVERGVPVSITEESRLVIREGNVATTYPITVTCELLQPAENPPTVATADTPDAPVTYDGPAPVPSSDLPVSDETSVEVGDVVQVEWSGEWYPADVLGVEEDGQLRIHFRGFSDRWDTTVHRVRVQLPGPEYSPEQASSDVHREE